MGLAWTTIHQRMRVNQSPVPVLVKRRAAEHVQLGQHARAAQRSSDDTRSRLARNFKGVVAHPIAVF